MTYFKINNVDFSMYVSALKVATKHNYKGQTNVDGIIRAQHKGSYNIVEVGIIPLDESSLTSLLTEINKFAVTISFRDPHTKQLKDIDCIIPENAIDYYTIQADNVKVKAFTLTFTEAIISSPYA